MIVRNGIRSILRERGRTALFSLLVVFLTVTLILSLSELLYCNAVIDFCDKEMRGMKPAAAKKRAVELIARVGLPETAMDRFPAMLSGGEQQRVAIARDLCMETKVLLADEPTGNLVTKNRDHIFRILERLAHKDGYCVVIVTHDSELGKRADETLRLQDGQLV